MAELKIKADSGGGTVSLKGPATTTSNAAVQLTLPVDDGAADQYLQTNGSGVLSWAAAGNTFPLVADDIQLHAADSQVIAKFHKTNSSEFHFNGSKKLEVTNTGISVTGSVTPSGGLYLGGSGGSNYMADYEEGTFTVTNSGAVNWAGGYDILQYIKIGKMVFISGEVECDTGSGSARITNLPFTVADLGETAGTGVGAFFAHEWDSGSGVGTGCKATEGTTTLELLVMRDNNSMWEMQGDNGAKGHISLMYRTT